jgi:hypothetical protein
MGAECAPASIFSVHSSLRILESKVRNRDGAIQCLYEKVLSPHDRFVHAQSLVKMVHAALQDPFPCGVAFGQVALAQLVRIRRAISL